MLEKVGRADAHIVGVAIIDRHGRSGIHPLDKPRAHRGRRDGQGVVQPRNGHIRRNLMGQTRLRRPEGIIDIVVGDQQHLVFPGVQRFMRHDPVDHARQCRRRLRRQPPDGQVGGSIPIQIGQGIIEAQGHRVPRVPGIVGNAVLDGRNVVGTRGRLSKIVVIVQMPIPRQAYILRRRGPQRLGMSQEARNGTGVPAAKSKVVIQLFDRHQNGIQPLLLPIRHQRGGGIGQCPRGNDHMRGARLHPPPPAGNDAVQAHGRQRLRHRQKTRHLGGVGRPGDPPFRKPGRFHRRGDPHRQQWIAHIIHLDGGSGKPAHGYGRRPGLRAKEQGIVARA